jgi:Sulfotransferase domain
MARVPDFYLVGAPKCGTTSLHRYLQQHDDVFMSEVKEPNFFCTDFPSIQKTKTLEEYTSLFSAARENQLAGEASPWYLYSKEAVANILQLKPDAKFIAVLRNPLDAVISHYRYMRYFLVEDRDEILDAVMLEDWGGGTKSVIRHRHATPFLKYRGLFSYSDQVARIKKLVPPENLLIVFFEEFFENPAENFKKITDFLNLPQQSVEMRAENQTMQWRFDFMRKFFVNQSPTAQLATAGIAKFLRKMGINLSDLLLKYLSRKSGEPNISLATKALLYGMFIDDLTKLSCLITLPQKIEWKIATAPEQPENAYVRKQKRVAKPVRAQVA